MRGILLQNSGSFSKAYIDPSQTIVLLYIQASLWVVTTACHCLERRSICTLAHHQHAPKNSQPHLSFPHARQFASLPNCPVGGNAGNAMATGDVSLDHSGITALPLQTRYSGVTACLHVFKHDGSAANLAESNMHALIARRSLAEILSV